MQKTVSYILWLPSWYPTKLDPFNGDFIQRHAQAVSLYHNVCVLFVVRDEKQVVTKIILEEESNNANLTERITYYTVGNVPAPLQKLVSYWRYTKFYKKAIRQYVEQHGLPDLVHVHVTLKAGLLATWIKKTWGVPYVITEHWTGFLPEAADNFKQQPAFFRHLCKQVWNSAASMSAVSQYLHEHLKKLTSAMEICVIPNVVDTTIFKPILFEIPITHTQFIHISGLGYQKNVDAILKAFAYVKEKQVLFQLHIFGPHTPHLLKLVHDLQLHTSVFFHLEVPQQQLAAQMQQADALILYSRYETFGCVVIEANACGLPVIVSDILSMRELVEEGVNGFFVPGDDAAALGEKLIWFCNNHHRFDAARIARRAQEQYDYKTVGLQFSNWYQAVLNNVNT
jgi:glycosyltransferase involved in cell wall biosynthesis